MNDSGDRFARAWSQLLSRHGAARKKMITAHHISARRADSILCAAMTFKLVESAQACWSAVNAPGLAALVRASARFERGILAGPAERDAA
jgi:hypothetical protein